MGRGAKLPETPSIWLYQGIMASESMVQLRESGRSRADFLDTPGIRQAGSRGKEITMWRNAVSLVVMLTLSVLMVPLATAQPRSSVPRIGILNSGTPAESHHLLA